MKAIIDLDWLDSEIEMAEIVLKSIVSDEYGILASMYNERIGSLEKVRSKCEPIEEPFILEVKGMITESKEPLPPKCLLDWESAKYCHNNDKCELCKTK